MSRGPCPIRCSELAISRLAARLDERAGVTVDMRLAFTISGSPGDGGINGAYRTGKNGRRFKTSTSRRFADRARIAAGNAHVVVGRPKVRVCSVAIRSYWPRRRHLAGCTDLAMGDVDAPVKAVLDSLEAAGILEDDALVREVRASKYLDKDNPRIEVEVYWTLDGTAPPSELCKPGAQKGKG